MSLEPLNLEGLNLEALDDACARARELASAWSDGESRCALELEQHLAGCGECRTFVDDLQSMRCELRELADAPTDDLWPLIASRARRAPRLQPRDALLRAAAALVGCVGTLGLLRATTGAPPREALPTDALAPLTALDARRLERDPLTASPEHQLLLALAASAEERR